MSYTTMEDLCKNRKYRKRIRKNAVINVRCTEEDKKRIGNKANKKEVSVGTYVVDCAIAGLERKSSKEKKRVTKLVSQQQELNDMYADIKNRTEPFSPEEVMEIVKKIERGVRGLWDF